MFLHAEAVDVKKYFWESSYKGTSKMVNKGCCVGRCTEHPGTLVPQGPLPGEECRNLFQQSLRVLFHLLFLVDRFIMLHEYRYGDMLRFNSSLFSPSTGPGYISQEGS